ncbi:hypothetical protein CVT23_03010 [Minwuia thermotolerans]|uniref:Uncharacterized protein n=1 Tax=Minwuia thermotolerans TaxID=2056226 RepID=A0A2M9G670_9PROT|nr:hypothetical protein CVT23_03010 [Minwuia thermotolerans]
MPSQSKPQTVDRRRQGSSAVPSQADRRASIRSGSPCMALRSTSRRLSSRGSMPATVSMLRQHVTDQPRTLRLKLRKDPRPERDSRVLKLSALSIGCRQVASNFVSGKSRSIAGASAVMRRLL